MILTAVNNDSVPYYILKNKEAFQVSITTAAKYKINMLKAV